MTDPTDPTSIHNIRRRNLLRTGWMAAEDRHVLLGMLGGLAEAIEHVVNDSPGTPDSVKRYLTRRLAEGGAGGEQA